MNESQLFANALKFATSAEQVAYLDEVCADDVILRAELEALLAAHASDPNFLEQPPTILGQTTADSSGRGASVKTEQPGTVLDGKYTLIEEIGEGGMGSVWMAQQTEPVKRLVAVKLIKAGMDSKQVITRFAAERQALAMLDHANIARVLDAGTTDAGRPYFVMDLVKGVPITRYCDERHLTPRQRLELFIPVCQAIQHAHQKGVIHRDIKPSNVLVALYDGVPVPKVIDFGVAKAAGAALTEKTLVTGFGAIVGTLEYMSPEQAEFNQLDVDTRSDVYSLGVLLYELLTGSPPFSRAEQPNAGMLEMLRVIREQEPTKPSAKLSTAEGLTSLAANRGTEPAKLTKLIRGELDWIVMKALEKDRNRRYETANGFALDVQRYLHDEPVLACPASAGYRFGKFVRRNRMPLMTASFVVAALLLGLAGSVWQAVRATRAEREKTQQLAIAEVRNAQALRNSGLAGRRFDSLEALKLAAKHFRELGQLDEQRALELRNEAIACLALADLKAGKEWTPEPGMSKHLGFDPTLRLYAVRPASDDDPNNLDRHQGDLSIRRVADDGEVARLPGFGIRATFVQVSPRGRYLAVHYGDPGRPIHDYVWDLDRREPVLKWQQPGHQMFPTFSPDDRLVAFNRPDHSIRICELPSGAVWKDLAPGLPVSRVCFHAVSFHPDGRRLAVLGEGTVQLREVDSGKTVATFQHPSTVTKLAWRSDGKVFVTACFDDDIYLWNMASPAQPLRVLKGHGAPVMDVAFSHGGDLLLSEGWDSTNRLWDAVTGQLLVSTPVRGQHQVHHFGPTDEGRDHGWQVATGRECRTFHGGKRQKRVAISPKGRLAASTCLDGVQLWNLAATREGDKLLATLPLGPALTVRFDPLGESLITDSKQVGLQRWPIATDPRTGDLRIGPPQSLCLSARAPYFGHDPDFALSADGRTIAHSSHTGGCILLFDLSNPRRRLAIESPHQRHAAFSPDGRWLAVGNWHGHGVKVWDARTGKLEADLPHATSPEHAAWPTFSPDGKWLVTGTSAEYSFWEVGSWRKKHALPRDKAARGFSWSVFSPDSKLLALHHAASEVRLVDPATGREFARLPTGLPSGFSADGSQLVTNAGKDGAFQLWDLRLIRRQLSEMDLDWNLPPYPPPGPEANKPLRALVLPAKPPPPSKELDAQALVERGLLFLQLRRLVEATRDFDRACSLDPKLTPPWGEVVRAYTGEIERHPKIASVWRYRANAHLRMGKEQEAIADYSRAIDLSPKDAELYYLRGSASGRFGRWEAAQADHAKAAEFAPTNLVFGCSHGYACAQLGQWETALAAFRHTTTSKVGDPLVWYYLAMVELQRGDQAGYRKACAETLAQHGDASSPDSAYWVAWTCVLAPDAVTDWAKPLKSAEKALADQPKRYERINALGAVLYRAGRFEEAARRLAEAEAAFEQAPTTRPSLAYNWLFQALVQHRLGHTEEAARWLEKAAKQIDSPPSDVVVDPNAKAWNRLLTLQLLRREAEELLGKKGL